MTVKASETGALSEQLRAELVAWDGIAAQVTPRRQRLMGTLLAELALQLGNGYTLEGLCCMQCGEPLVYKGTPQREVSYDEDRLHGRKIGHGLAILRNVAITLLRRAGYPYIPDGWRDIAVQEGHGLPPLTKG